MYSGIKATTGEVIVEKTEWRAVHKGGRAEDSERKMRAQLGVAQNKTTQKWTETVSEERS